MHACSWATCCGAVCVVAALNSAAAQTNEAPAVPLTGNTVIVQPDNTVIVQPGPAAAESGDDIVCQIVAPTTGTRLGGGRECHKRREWLQRQHDAQDITRHQETTGFIWNPKGAGH